MEWMQLPSGPWQTNTYILYGADRSCLIVDPGGGEQKIRQFIQRKKLQPKAILLTHAHFDHIGAADFFREAFQIPLYVHRAEKKWLADPERNGSFSVEGAAPVVIQPADGFFTKEEKVAIGGFSFWVLETPGHSPGSVCFYFKESGLVLTGDTLFKESIGRTDVKGGEEAVLLKSIETKLFSLPDDVYVLPGHDSITTIGEERTDNPFLKKKQ